LFSCCCCLYKKLNNLKTKEYIKIEIEKEEKNSQPFLTLLKSHSFFFVFDKKHIIAWREMKSKKKSFNKKQQQQQLKL